MRNQEKLIGLLIIILIIFIASNINGINSFLSGTTDKTIEFGHSASVVPKLQMQLPTSMFILTIGTTGPKTI